MVLLSLIGVVIAMQLISLGAGIYKTPTRLINTTAINEQLKWELICRWGA